MDIVIFLMNLVLQFILVHYIFLQKLYFSFYHLLLFILWYFILLLSVMYFLLNDMIFILTWIDIMLLPIVVKLILEWLEFLLRLFNTFITNLIHRWFLFSICYSDLFFRLSFYNSIIIFSYSIVLRWSSFSLALIWS